MSYIPGQTYADLDATVRVRVPEGFTGDAHSGLLFRYTRNSPIGYDPNVDKGYILEIEEGTGSTFELTLEDAYVNRLHFATVPGGFNTWHILRVVAIGPEITAYFNGQEIFTVTDSLYSSGNIGFGSHASVSQFNNLNVCAVEANEIP